MQRQYCGAVGEREDCVVAVPLGCARDGFHCLLDGELDLPEGWSDDRDRCREAGIPDAMVYRPEWEIARELYDRAVKNGLHFDWLTFDEGYGGEPGLLRAPAARRRRSVAEVPRDFTGRVKSPRVVTRPFRRKGRRARKAPRPASGSPPARRVDAMLDQDGSRDQPWVRWRVKDARKGPMLWEVEHQRFPPMGEAGPPGGPLHLIVARDALDPAEVEFFVSDAPAETSVGVPLRVAFSRWRVERCSEDQEGEIGLDRYEGRRYQGLERHLVLGMVSYLFLSRVREGFGGEDPELTG